jgi:hypothetical protein
MHVPQDLNRATSDHNWLIHYSSMHVAQDSCIFELDKICTFQCLPGFDFPTLRQEHHRGPTRVGSAARLSAPGRRPQADPRRASVARLNVGLTPGRGYSRCAGPRVTVTRLPGGRRGLPRPGDRDPGDRGSLGPL